MHANHKLKSAMWHQNPIITWDKNVNLNVKIMRDDEPDGTVANYYFTNRKYSLQKEDTCAEHSIN